MLKEAQSSEDVLSWSLNLILRTVVFLELSSALLLLLYKMLSPRRMRMQPKGKETYFFSSLRLFFLTTLKLILFLDIASAVSSSLSYNGKI